MSCSQNAGDTLSSVAQWVACCPAKQKFAGLIPGRGIWLDCRPGPWLGGCEKKPINVSLVHQCFSLSLSPSLSFCLKFINWLINKASWWQPQGSEGLTGWRTYVYIGQLTWLQAATGCWCKASVSHSECFSTRLLECLCDMVLPSQIANVLRERSQVNATSLLWPSLKSHIGSLLFIQGEEN